MGENTQFKKKKKQNLSCESAGTPEYTDVYLGSKSSNQGRSGITFDLLYQAAVVMCLITFIIIIRQLSTVQGEAGFS